MLGLCRKTPVFPRKAKKEKPHDAAGFDSTDLPFNPILNPKNQTIQRAALVIPTSALISRYLERNIEERPF